MGKRWCHVSIPLTQAMIGENGQLVTNEPVEVQDCTKITDHLRGIYRVYSNLIKENRRMLTHYQLDLQTLGSQPIMPKNLPDHCTQGLIPHMDGCPALYVLQGRAPKDMPRLREGHVPVRELQ